jgi:hypothetical protein
VADPGGVHDTLQTLVEARITRLFLLPLMPVRPLYCRWLPPSPASGGCLSARCPAARPHWMQHR